MSVGSYVQFTKYQDAVVTNVDAAIDTRGWGGASGQKIPDGKTLFEIEDWAFDVEQTLNIGSQSSGAGAGKITFNPFSITRKVDSYSVDLFAACASGTPFEFVRLFQTKGGSGGGSKPLIYLTYHFKLVAVKAIGWTGDDDSPRQNVDFAYGGLVIEYHQQGPDGRLLAPNTQGWNRVKNVRDSNATEGNIK